MTNARKWMIGFGTLMAAWLLIGMLTCGGCSHEPGSYLRPVDAVALSQLTPAEDRELAVYSKNHANLYDLRIHSIETCPILTYPPHYFLLHDKPGYGRWLLDFYREKHNEECNLPWRHCTCEAELAQPTTQKAKP